MTPRELAAAIRKGHTMVGEANHFMTWARRDDPSAANCCCALGAAWYGIGKSERDYWDSPVTNTTLFAKVFDMPKTFLDEVSSKHVSGIPRLAIADWLDTLEPETKPADKQSFDSFMATVMQPVAVTV